MSSGIRSFSMLVPVASRVRSAMCNCGLRHASAMQAARELAWINLRQRLRHVQETSCYYVEDGSLRWHSDLSCYIWVNICNLEGCSILGASSRHKCCLQAVENVAVHAGADGGAAVAAE